MIKKLSIQKIFLLLFCLGYINTSVADTLFILAKKFGQPAIYFEHVHVLDYGLNSAGAFVVRLTSGQEIYYGRPGFWEVFDYYSVLDADSLRK